MPNSLVCRDARGLKDIIKSPKPMVNFSLASASNLLPVSPGANEMSKVVTILASVVRTLSSASGLPMQPYGPVERMSLLSHNTI